MKGEFPSQRASNVESVLFDDVIMTTASVTRYCEHSIAYEALTSFIILENECMFTI